jgi:hypothetical protein
MELFRTIIEVFNDLTFQSHIRNNIWNAPKNIDYDKISPLHKTRRRKEECQIDKKDA